MTGDKVTPGLVPPGADKSCTERDAHSVTRVAMYLSVGLKSLSVELISQEEWCDVEQADDWYGSRYN